FFLVQRACPYMGGQDKTFLSARPSAVVPQGGNVTLRCHYRRGLYNFPSFTLYKDDRSHIPILHSRIFQESFLMGPVIQAHAGTYRCRGSYPHSPTEWSALSEPLAIRVTGVHKKPSLLALPGPLVKSGEMVILQCSSDTVFEHFFLQSEGTFEEPLAPWWGFPGQLFHQFHDVYPSRDLQMLRFCHSLPLCVVSSQ
uniref:Immunoglobulin domain-containing protein n=1 Tax=Rhinopithecus bieti TaxID=61621 RepID=A0A2K6MVW8_RHIBE